MILRRMGMRVDNFFARAAMPPATPTPNTYIHPS